MPNLQLILLIELFLADVSQKIMFTTCKESSHVMCTLMIVSLKRGMRN